MKLQLLKFIFPLSFLFAACSDDAVPTGPVLPPATAAYVLSEGTFSGEAKLGLYDLGSGTFNGDYFNTQNGSALGQIGNHIIQYGGKIYIVMNLTGNVTVIDRNTGLLISRVNFVSSNPSRLPRFAIAADGKVFVSAQNGTVNVIDTTSLNITSSITVGSNPEQMAVSGNKLFVTNSGGFNFPNYDSTVSVIDIPTLAETGKIKVGINPRRIAADNSGNVYVVVTGNYSTIVPKLVKLNAASETVSFSADSAVSTIDFYDNKLFVTNDFAYTGLSSNVRVLNPDNFSNLSNSFITDGTDIETPYGLSIDPNNGDVYVTDAKDFTVSGAVYCFNSQGQLRFSFSVSPGVSPNGLVFKR
jgi:YVTN family beta-propeller protein